MDGLPPPDSIKPLFLNEDLTSVDPNAIFPGSMIPAPGPSVLASQEEYCAVEVPVGMEVGHVETPAKDSNDGHNCAVVVKQFLQVPVISSADAKPHQVTDSSVNPVATVVEAMPMDSGGGPGGAVESCPVGPASTGKELADLPRAPDDDRISVKAPEDGELFTEETKSIKPKKKSRKRRGRRTKKPKRRAATPSPEPVQASSSSAVTSSSRTTSTSSSASASTPDRRPQKKSKVKHRRVQSESPRPTKRRRQQSPESRQSPLHR